MKLIMLLWVTLNLQTKYSHPPVILHTIVHPFISSTSFASKRKRKRRWAREVRSMKIIKTPWWTWINRKYIYLAIAFYAFQAPRNAHKFTWKINCNFLLLVRGGNLIDAVDCLRLPVFHSQSYRLIMIDFLPLTMAFCVSLSNFVKHNGVCHWSRDIVCIPLRLVAIYACEYLKRLQNYNYYVCAFE